MYGVLAEYHLRPRAYYLIKEVVCMRAFLRGHTGSILAAGVAIQILTGVPAAWGVFQRAVCETYGFAPEVASMIFSLIICFFGIGCVVGGYLQDKRGPRTAGFFGTVLLSSGFAAAAFVPSGAAWLFYLGFSVPVGMGCAFLYPAVMSCAQKWYAEKKGLATGVIGGAVGLSGATLTFLGRFLIDGWGIRTAFFTLGAAMALVCGAACVFLVNPDTAPPQRTQNGTSMKKSADCTVWQMLKMPQYWLLFAATGLATPAVLLFSPIIVEYAQERGLSEAAGLACIIVGSVCSAAGRLLMPWLSDHIGRRATDLILFAALCGLSAAFMAAQGWWVLALYSLLTLCYSGEAAVIPAAVTDLFGQKQSGLHYGLVALGMSVGSVGFPLAARLLHMDAARHWVAVGATAVGFFCIWLLKPTQGKRL